MMLSILRIGAARALTGTSQRDLVRAVPLARAFGGYRSSNRGLATVTAATGGTTTKTPRKPRTASATGGRMAASAKKPKVKKPKKPKKEKLQPWQLRGADGKLVPLPSATKPKKGPSPYLLYLKSRSGDLRNDSSMFKDGAPGKLDVTKMTQKLASEWNSMSDSDKQPFYQESEKGRREADAAIQRWRESLTSEDIKRQNAYLRAQKAKGKTPGMGKLRDPSKPKQPTSSFFQFMTEYRAKSGSGKSVQEVAKEAASEWNSMSKDQKQPYESKFENEKAQYQRELQQN